MTYPRVTFSSIVNRPFLQLYTVFACPYWKWPRFVWNVTDFRWKASSHYALECRGFLPKQSYRYIACCLHPKAMLLKSANVKLDVTAKKMAVLNRVSFPLKLNNVYEIHLHLLQQQWVVLSHTREPHLLESLPKSWKLLLTRRLVNFFHKIKASRGYFGKALIKYWFCHWQRVVEKTLNLSPCRTTPMDYSYGLP